MSKPILTLIRGLPGSGKSTLARKLVADADLAGHEAQQKTVHLEADMYFVNASGEYCFQSESLKSAHEWCENECEKYLQQQHNVVVSNTFVRHWEMKAYQQLAKQYNAKIEVIVCKGKFASIHDVPAETIKRMKQQWQA
ncbi:ATP-binding protein [Psychromonas algicola]|uniref:ATP-binding protein n=1 Tax=Psychromonas algicola TaxID=2555642 RepID=UPI00106751CA|nr:ATP-binding protein [Psychromonas sp. RZ5]TEW45337.1 ATP-binding protein [Psychromonas sp. RZ5]